MQLEVLGHHVPETVEPHMHHLKHPCTLCSAGKGLGSERKVPLVMHIGGVECCQMTCCPDELCFMLSKGC